MSKHGPVRLTLETMKGIARISGLTLEQIADFYDAFERMNAEPKQTTSDDVRPNVSAPKGVQ